MAPGHGREHGTAVARVCPTVGCRYRAPGMPPPVPANHGTGRATRPARPPCPLRDAPPVPGHPDERHAPGVPRHDTRPVRRSRDRDVRAVAIGRGAKPRVGPVVAFVDPGPNAGVRADDVRPVRAAPDAGVTGPRDRSGGDPERPFGHDRSGPPCAVTAPVTHTRNVDHTAGHPKRRGHKPDHGFGTPGVARVARQNHRRTPRPESTGRPVRAAFCVPPSVRRRRSY